MPNLVETILSVASNTVGSNQIIDGSIVNADINSSAAIAYSKINLSSSIVNADVASGAAIAYSKLNLTGAIQANDLLANAAVKSLTGTANEVEISASTGSVTIGLPDDVTVGGNLTVTGDLIVSGNTTTLNTANLQVEDNFILLNSGVSGAPNLNAGLEVERGSSTNVDIRWNESTDKWQFTNDGSIYRDIGSGSVTVSDTAPASPDNGSVWFESDTAKTFVYYDDGSSSQWVEIGASGMAAFVSDSAPTNPINGQIWYESDTGGTYVYYSNVWVEIGAAPFNELLNKIDAKGDLLVGSADNTAIKLAAGTNGYVLIANSSTASGLNWGIDPTADLVTTKGDIVAASAADTLIRLGVGSDGLALLANSSTASGLEWGQAGVAADSDQSVLGGQIFG
jgi:hypothetical protein